MTPSIAWSLLGGCLRAPGLDGAADPKHVLGVSTGCISFPQAQGGSAVSLGGLCSLPEHGRGKETEADPDWQSPGGNISPGGVLPGSPRQAGCCRVLCCVCLFWMSRTEGTSASAVCICGSRNSSCFPFTR